MKDPYASITFLTYENMEAGDHFYRVVLGLPLIEDQGWAKVYRIHGAANVGIVKARHGLVESPVGSGMLLSIVVEDVDMWYEQLKDEPSIEVLGPPAMVSDIPVYRFFFKDPAGDHIEIQSFTRPQTIDQIKFLLQPLASTWRRRVLPRCCPEVSGDEALRWVLWK